MPFDSQGKFYRLHNWEQDRIDDIDIVSDHHDEEDDNFAQGLNECVLRNGLVPMEANLNLGGFRINNVGKATSVNDAINKQQLEEAKSDIADKLNQTLCVGDIKCSALQKDHYEEQTHQSARRKQRVRRWRQGKNRRNEKAQQGQELARC